MKERKNIAWRLYGAGLEKLRRDEIAIPEPKPEEIVIRIDAVGLCFSGSSLKISSIPERLFRFSSKNLKT